MTLQIAVPESTLKACASNSTEQHTQNLGVYPQLRIEQHTGHAYTDVPAVSGLVVKDPLTEGTASSAVLAQLSGQVMLGGMPVTSRQGCCGRITCKTDSARSDHCMQKMWLHCVTNGDSPLTPWSSFVSHTNFTAVPDLRCASGYLQGLQPGTMVRRKRPVRAFWQSIQFVPIRSSKDKGCALKKAHCWPILALYQHCMCLYQTC